MKNTIQDKENQLLIRYSWKDKAWHSITLTADNVPLPMRPDTEFEFITKHYFGFTKRKDQTSEYEICHPKWEYYEVKSYDLAVDFETLYGKDFQCLNHQQPISVMLAESSEIQVKTQKYTEIINNGAKMSNPTAKKLTQSLMLIMTIFNGAKNQ